MFCSVCGKRLKSSKSRKLGYGPICYKKTFGTSGQKRAASKPPSSADSLPYCIIQGQMCIGDYLREMNIE